MVEISSSHTSWATPVLRSQSHKEVPVPRLEAGDDNGCLNHAFNTVANVEQEKLEDMLEALLNPDTASKIKFRLDKGVPTGEKPQPPVEEGFALSNVRVVVDQSMAFAVLDLDYPVKMPIYLYGSKSEVHVDHVLKKAPNAQISADLVETDLAARLTGEELRNGVVVVPDDVFEACLQPLTEEAQAQPRGLGLSLKEGVDHKASVYHTCEEAKSGEGKPIATGTISVGKTVYADWDDVNMDPAAENDGVVSYHSGGSGSRQLPAAPSQARSAFASPSYIMKRGFGRLGSCDAAKVEPRLQRW
ncbi:hypothetical protein CSOJ01_11308 [Colletotrichum sojae]|uniref:Uncharacterized protein n=1 Tax=Colletotrichum sojae TaxID=2175907 RepID=A0A8H6IYR3_9PEZI|nr:hypothetical protein CSOJ01_11308 [Colletotrichum sojae]